MNSRLDPVQAAALRVKLPHLDAWNARRAQAAAQYTEALAGTDLVLPAVLDEVDPVWHLYVVRSAARDALQERLRTAGIGTLIHYPLPPHLQPAYASLGMGTGSFPVAEAIHDEIMSLPIGPHMSLDTVSRVASAISCDD